MAYFATKFWLTPEVSNFPDIDEAFHAGLAVLKENGLSIETVPIFLAIGPSDADDAGAVFSSAGFKYVAAGIPKGNHPVRWYIKEDAVFLVTTGMGCIGRYNLLAKQAAPDLSRTQMELPDMPRGSQGTLVASGPMTGGGGASGDSVTPDDFGGGEAASPPVPRGFTGTIVADDSFNRREPGAEESTVRRFPTRVSFSRDESDEQRERMKHLLALLRRERQPLCTLNGTLVLLPWQSLESDFIVEQFIGTLKTDLTEIQDSTDLRMPTVLLVYGMENEQGFVELIRGVGMNDAKHGRFGKGFDVEIEADVPALTACAMDASRAFETWVYELYKRPEALGQQQKNSRLFGLLGKVRTEVQGRLRRLMVQGIGFGTDSRFLFAGCYFGACGARDGQRAFVASVLKDRLIDLQAEIEWTEDAAQRDSWYHFLRRPGFR